MVKYNGIERVKIVKDEVEQAALKSILNHASPRAVLENLSRNKCYRKEMLEIVKKVVQSEIKQISKKNSDVFKGHASNNEKLVKFDWKCTSQKLQVQAPFLYSTFSSIVGLQKNDAYIYFSNFVWKITDHESVAVHTWLNSSEMWS